MNLSITVIRSRRRTLALEIRPDCTVTVRAPLACTDEEIRRFVARKESWILSHLEKMRSETARTDPASDAPRRLSSRELKALADAAMKDLEDPLGQLQRRRKPEFQLPPDDGSSGDPGLRRGARAVPQKRTEPLRPFLGGGGTCSSRPQRKTEVAERTRKRPDGPYLLITPSFPPPCHYRAFFSFSAISACSSGTVVPGVHATIFGPFS